MNDDDNGSFPLRAVPSQAPSLPSLPSLPSFPSLPHHKLLAYGVARELVLAVVAARFRDAKLRDEALRAAKGAGRVSPADKARAFAIARGEAAEAAAAVEIAAACGDASPEAAAQVGRLASRLYAMLTPLARRR